MDPPFKENNSQKRNRNAAESKKEWCMIRHGGGYRGILNSLKFVQESMQFCQVRLSLVSSVTVCNSSRVHGDYFGI